MVEPVIPKKLLHVLQWHSCQKLENMLTFSRDQKYIKVVKRAGSRSLLGFLSSLYYQTTVTWGQLLKISGNQTYEMPLAVTNFGGSYLFPRLFFNLLIEIQCIHFTKKYSASGKARTLTR